MPSPPVIDFERLLAPLPGDNPCGEDVSMSGVISEIKELRRADEEGHQGEWQLKEPKSADWSKAIKVTTEILATKTKDLRIAAYLVECITKVHGMAGLRDGLKLICEYHTQYWDTVYPMIEEDDIEFRSGSLVMLDSIVPIRIREQKVTKSMGGAVYSQLEWEESKRVDELERTNQEYFKQALEDGKITGETFRKAVGTTPKSYYEKFIGDLDEGWEEVLRTNALIEEKYGAAGGYDIPILSQIKKTLETTRNLSFEIEKLVGAVRAVPVAPPTDTDEQAQGAGAGSSSGSTQVYTGPGVPLEPMDREDAIRRLNAVANYFRKREPHSPVAYLVDRAVTWGQMPLEKWLEEVVKDGNTLTAIRELLGIKVQEG